MTDLGKFCPTSISATYEGREPPRPTTHSLTGAGGGGGALSPVPLRSTCPTLLHPPVAGGAKHDVHGQCRGAKAKFNSQRMDKA